MSLRYISWPLTKPTGFSNTVVCRPAEPQVVKFLHEFRGEGCTTAAVDNAASGGHLELLKFLCSNREEGGTVYAMILAAWHGHMDVLKWLHYNRDEVRTGAGSEELKRGTRYLLVVRACTYYTCDGCGDA